MKFIGADTGGNHGLGDGADLARGKAGDCSRVHISVNNNRDLVEECWQKIIWNMPVIGGGGGSLISDHGWAWTWWDQKCCWC